MHVDVDIDTVIEEVPLHPAMRVLDAVADTILVAAVLGELHPLEPIIDFRGSRRVAFEARVEAEQIADAHLLI